MSKLVAAMLVRNEGAPDRYLERVLRDAWRWATDIVVVDDGSTDNTRDIASDVGCIFLPRHGGPMWGNEAPARAELWNVAAKVAGDGWVLVLDADMILSGDPRPLTESWACDAWAWPLYDLWDSEDTYRVDGAWRYGPVTPRPWLFRPSALREPPRWRDSALHTGHAPANFAGLVGVASQLFWHHLAYVSPQHRKLKHAKYLEHRASLTPFELAHADSIADG